MNDQSPDLPIPQSDAVERASLFRSRQRALVMLATLAAMSLIYWATTRDALSMDSLLRITMILLTGLAAALWVDRRCWRRSARALCQSLPQVRAGMLPIDSLEAVRVAHPSTSALVDGIQELLRDNRMQRAEVNALEQELRQRVARRTHALERLVGSLRQQATRDALTGLFNRRFLDRYLPQVYERCCAEGTNLALLMMDIDEFKLLNDTLGHAGGDEMLQLTAQVIRSGIRGEDAAFRFGGDEFVVLMPATSREGAQAFAERLAALVNRIGARWKVPSPPKLTIGVATRLDMPGATPAELLAEADRALYKQKNSHRRRPLPAPNAA